MQSVRAAEANHCFAFARRQIPKVSSVVSVLMFHIYIVVHNLFWQKVGQEGTLKIKSQRDVSFHRQQPASSDATKGRKKNKSFLGF